MGKHFDIFRQLFPVTRIRVYEDSMIYSFRNPTTARYFEGMAQEIIIANGLPLVAELKIWEKGGYVFEISMTVEMALEIKMVREAELIPCY